MNWDDPVFGAPGAPSQQLLKGYYLIERSDPQTWPSSVPVEDRVYIGDVDPEDSEPTTEVLPIYGPFTDGPIGYVTVVTDDGDAAQPGVLRPLPVVFDDVIVKNRNDLWGTELMYSYRTHPQQHGGFFEMYFGARYLEFNDLFSVDARNRIPAKTRTKTAMSIHTTNGYPTGPPGRRWQTAIGTQQPTTILWGPRSL